MKTVNPAGFGSRPSSSTFRLYQRSGGPLCEPCWLKSIPLSFVFVNNRSSGCMVRDESFRRFGRGESSKKKSVGKEKRRMRIINRETDLVPLT